MQQEFLLLAESAEVVNGKLYMLGGGADRHLAQSFPVQLRADVAVGILVGWNETNRLHGMKLAIVDEDENPVMQLEGQFETGRPPGAKAGQDMRTMIAIRGPFPIQKAGAYKISLELNGKRQEPPFRFWVEEVQVPGQPLKTK